MSDIRCDLCGKNIEDLRSMRTSEIADGMFFCSNTCMDEYEEDNYQCELTCPNCNSHTVMEVFNTAEHEGFLQDDEDEDCYICEKCNTMGIYMKTTEK